MELYLDLYYNENFVSNGTSFYKFMINVAGYGCFGSLYNPKTQTFEDQKFVYTSIHSIYKAFQTKWIRKTRNDKIYHEVISTNNFLKEDMDSIPASFNVFKTRLDAPMKKLLYVWTDNNYKEMKDELRRFINDFMEKMIHNEDNKESSSENKSFQKYNGETTSLSDIIIKHFTFTTEDMKHNGRIYRIIDNEIYFKEDKYEVKREVIKARTKIKLAKMLNSEGFNHLINGNFYEYNLNPQNSNYIIINGINVNKNRVKLIDAYSEPPVSNADALKEVNT